MEPPARGWSNQGRRQGTRRENRGTLGKLASLCHLLNEHGDAIEADLLRFYRVDLLDFYRGTMSARRLGVLVGQLPAEAAVVRALNGGQMLWTNTDHRLADLWALQAKAHFGDKVGDHPKRAEMEAAARNAAKVARVVDLKARFEKHKRTYGLE